MPVAGACLAVLLTVAGASPAAWGAGPPGAGRASVLPDGFHAQSMSWVSPEHGWLLGSRPCGQTTCTTVVGTVDGGATWNTLGTLDAPLSLGERKSGVDQVRFADDLHGWAFGPALWATKDGGATWKRRVPPGGGRQVPAVAGDADGVYAVVSPCHFNRPISRCHARSTLWRSMPGQGLWTQVPLTLPVTREATLVVRGAAAYLVVPTFDSRRPDVLAATVDGQTWSRRPAPCNKGEDEFLAGVAPISDRKVALMCEAYIGFGKAEKRVLQSNDTGRSTTSAGTLPEYGIVSQLVAAPNGTLVVATSSIGSWIYRDARGRSWTTPVDIGDGGQGWNDVVFTTNRIGFVIHGPAACCGGHGAGELGGTTDGGISWAPL
jgi:photosystem II stability/assembly factor-like uncharacterized protein